MTDILLYWRDYQQNWAEQSAGERELTWHSNAGLFTELHPGDRLWLVTSGHNLKAQAHQAPQAGFLVAVWQVQQVQPNPGDDPAYPSADYRYRVTADASASILLDEPVFVDHIVRPNGRDQAKAIGAFLQGPRRLTDEKVRLLRTAAGPLMARHYLAGRRV